MPEFNSVQVYFDTFIGIIRITFENPTELLHRYRYTLSGSGNRRGGHQRHIINDSIGFGDFGSGGIPFYPETMSADQAFGNTITKYSLPFIVGISIRNVTAIIIQIQINIFLSQQPVNGDI